MRDSREEILFNKYELRQVLLNQDEQLSKEIDACDRDYILNVSVDDFSLYNYARKPQAFKPGDEWHPFGAKRRPFPACLAWLKVMTGMPEA